MIKHDQQATLSVIPTNILKLYQPTLDILLIPSPHLWGKICNVGFLFLQSSLRNKHGEVAVLHTQLLDLTVKEFFDGLPDGERPGSQHVTAADIIILDHLGLGDHLHME